MSSPAFVTAAGLVAAGIPPPPAPPPPSPPPSHDPGPLYRRRQDNLEVATTLTALSLAFGSVSVFATLFALYWFVQMRRSFRHDLIMLLIQSDLIKALCFTLFPLVSLARGPIASDSAWCQAGGFFLAFGIESSDVAVLLMAVHSLLYLLRPQSGLDPHRHAAYAAWLLGPLALAALAFAGAGGQGYENVGRYCYLGADPGWARLWLSWVPRYVVCATVLVLYVFVYAYVRRKMDAYGRRSSAAGLQPLSSSSSAAADLPPPPIPPLAYHGLIPSTPRSRRGSVAPPADDPDGSGSSSSSEERQSSSAGTLVAPPTPQPGAAFPGAEDTGIARHRATVRRQLRALFAYPLAYVLTWVFPFAAHVRGLDGAAAAAGPVGPHWLLVVGAVGLCVQGAVDAALFTARERPWRHGDVRRGRGRGVGVLGGGGAGAGRTREEMLVHGRLARARREEEIAVERGRSGSFGGEGGERKGSVAGSAAATAAEKKTRREWWDVEEDGDGIVGEADVVQHV